MGATACARGGRTPLITQLLSPSSPVCRADKSASNDKMRLTLNLGDDAMYPAGHPLGPCCLSSSLSLSLFPSYVPWERRVEEGKKCRQAEVIVFRVNMMWPASNVCGNRWTALPWEINSVGVTADDCDGRCKVRASRGWERVSGLLCVCESTHRQTSALCADVFIYLFLTTRRESLIRISYVGLGERKDLLPNNADGGTLRGIIRLVSIRRESSRC